MVVKNTFIDVDGDSDESFDDDKEHRKMNMNRRQSDSRVRYGTQAQSPKKKLQESAPGPTSPKNPAPRGNRKRQSLQSANEFGMNPDDPYGTGMYDMYDRRGSLASIMTSDTPMAKYDDLGFGFGFGMGTDASGKGGKPATDPFGGMPAPYGAPRPPMPGMAPPYAHPWWPYMPPYMPPAPFMSTQPPPFMPPMAGFPAMPDYEQLSQPTPTGKGGSKSAGGKGSGKSGGHTRTTIMLRNLPPEYTRDMTTELLDAEGFSGLYDFVYMPMNLRTKESFGYVFVDLISPVVADQCRSRFQGFNKWSIQSDKACDVLWSDEQQGLSANIERYRNSPVMHESVPEDCKPVVFANGIRMQFPPPTKRLREPRIRRAAPKEKEEDANQ